MPVAARLVTLMSRAETCVTFNPGTVRSRSAKFFDGAFWIASLVITLIVAGALISFSSDRDALTTTVSSYFAGSSGFWVAAGSFSGG